MPASAQQPGGTARQLAEPVAIVGMDVLLPRAGSLEDYWNNLVNGVDAISDVPANRWEPEFYDPERADQPNRIYCRRGGFVDNLAYFDPMPYGVMPASVPETEPEQLLALRVTAGAIADAGGLDRLPDRDRVGVILGRLGQSSVTSIKFFLRVMLPDQMCSYMSELLPELTKDQLDRVRARTIEQLGAYHPENVIGLMPNLTASRVANRLGLRGPAYILDAACASSLIAVDHGIAQLMNGGLDAVVVGGVHHNHDVTFWSVFSQLRALSRSQQIRPFDVAADGLLIGEGTGAVVLKRLSDAVRDGDRIYAVIRGIGVSSDGRSASLVNPETTGQLLAVRRAWASAGLDPAAPDAVGMLEAHGTGTPAGDATELTTIAHAFGPPQPGNSPPVIGSVKSMIGHAMPAAGIASLVKTVLAVSNGTLLPTLHCGTPREEMARTRFMPIATTRPWDQAGPRRAAVNAFGFGGINVHLIVEQTPDLPRVRGRSQPLAAPAAAAVYEPDQIVLLAGPDPAAVARLLAAEDHEVRAQGSTGARGGENSGACRLGIADPTPERLAAARKVVAAGAAWRGGRDIWFSPRPMLAGGQGGIAFVFPGLEAEFSDNVQDVAAHFGLSQPDADEQDFSGRFIAAMGQGWLLHQALLRMGVKPDAVAGHSLGEWTALLVSGWASESTLDETATLMFDPGRERKDLLHAVIGASAEAVTGRLGRYPGVVISIDNAPAQSVVCGPAGQVERLIAEFGRDGVLCRPLPFTTGVHTPYLKPVIEQVRPLVAEMRSRAAPSPVRQEVRQEAAHEVQPARVTAWSATTAAPFPADDEERLELMYRQLVEPIRFRATLTAMHDAGLRAFLQVGAGQLASLVTDNLRERDHLSIAVNVAFRSGLAQLQRVAAALWVEGYPADPRSLEPVRSPVAARPVAARPAAARPAAARPASAARSMPIRVELGTERIRLGEGAGELLDRTAIAQPAGARPGPAGPALPPSSVPASHSELAGRWAVASELAALLEESAGAVAAVVSAAGQRAGSPTRVPAARAALAPAKPAGHGGPPLDNGGPPPGDGGPQAGQAGPPGTVAPLPRGGERAAADGDDGSLRTTTLRAGLDDMPYLIDHCFNPQPAGWPDVADLNPVMPAVTIIQHMIDAVEAAAPGMRVIQVADARFLTWVLVVPPVDVQIHVRRVAPGEFVVAFGGYARATLRTAASYPDPPLVWHEDPATERPSPLSVADMYAQRVMFHGPAYRGVETVHAVGDRHIRGRLRRPAPPGALLDSGLQLIGNWTHVILPARNVMFPTSFGSIRFFGPVPPVGAAVECITRIHTVDERHVIGDIQYASGGRVWAQIKDCTTRRFDSHPRSRAAETAPGRNAFAVRQPEGWVVSFDYWPDPASQNSIVSLVLGAAGYAEYEAQPVVRRKGWLLSRLAVKDVIRYHLWDADPDREIFPIEVSVSDGADGRPQVRGWAGLTIPGYQISSAMARNLGVAIARPAGPANGAGALGVGIGVAEIGGDPKLRPAGPGLAGPELAVLDQAMLNQALVDEPLPDAAERGTDRGMWLARFAAAKEAVAKAVGTGAGEEAGPLAVTAATSTAITVSSSGRRYLVSHREVRTPPELPARRYVVAWT